MPNLKEYLAFGNKEKTAYRAKIRGPHYPDRVLEDNVYRKRREVHGAAWAMGASLGLIHLTAGASTIGATAAYRTLKIECEKLVMLEQEWCDRGYARLPNHTFRDKVIPCIIGAGVVAVNLGLDVGLGAAGSAAINHAALAGGHHLAYNVVQNHAIAPGTGHELGQGIVNGVQQTLGVAQGQSSAFAIASPACVPAYATGQAIGMHAAHEGITHGTQVLANWAQNKVTHLSKVSNIPSINILWPLLIRAYFRNTKFPGGQNGISFRSLYKIHYIYNSRRYMTTADI